MSEAASYGRLEGTLGWRLRHPRRALRAIIPNVLPRSFRTAAGRVLTGATAEPPVAQWLAEITEFPTQPNPQSADRPVASIHIVTHNNLEVTRLCVESIRRFTAGVAYEIVVVDNGSTDGTVGWLEQQRRRGAPLEVIELGTNSGFARACNAAVAASSGSVVCLLNNDIVVTPGWLSRLCRALETWDGLAGPTTNSCGNEARVDPRVGSLASMLDFARQQTRANAGRAFAIPMLGFYCIAMRRSTWERVGPLDERFGIGMFEDDDYARRALMAGLPVVCVEDVFIHHWGRATFRTLGAAEYARLYDENRRAFRAKWRR